MRKWWLRWRLSRIERRVAVAWKEHDEYCELALTMRQAATAYSQRAAELGTQANLLRDRLREPSPYFASITPAPAVDATPVARLHVAGGKDRCQ